MSEPLLIEAVKNGAYAEAEQLIRSGTDVNQQDEQGWTPLNFAAGKGDLSLIKLLVENGADVFKVGRDRRTPYMIALAAGRVTVVQYLGTVEDNYTGEKPARPERNYCKAYYLGDLRKYSAWIENRINWKNKENGDRDVNSSSEEPFTDERIVFIHQDFTVTESMLHNENLIFNQGDSAWKDFCANTLSFKVPDDLDLIPALG
jgi:uncharacterized protein